MFVYETEKERGRDAEFEQTTNTPKIVRTSAGEYVLFSQAYLTFNKIFCLMTENDKCRPIYSSY